MSTAVEDIGLEEVIGYVDNDYHPGFTNLDEKMEIEKIFREIEELSEEQQDRLVVANNLDVNYETAAELADVSPLVAAGFLYRETGEMLETEKRRRNNLDDEQRKTLLESYMHEWKRIYNITHDVSEAGDYSPKVEEVIHYLEQAGFKDARREQRDLGVSKDSIHASNEIDSKFMDEENLDHEVAVYALFVEKADVTKEDLREFADELEKDEETLIKYAEQAEWAFPVNNHTFRLEEYENESKHDRASAEVLTARSYVKNEVL